jgi:hypothetical protein
MVRDTSGLFTEVRPIINELLKSPVDEKARVIATRLSPFCA